MFARKFLVLFSIFLTIIFCVATNSAQDLNQRSPETTWELSVKLMPLDGLPASVQFAVFDQDPVPDFKKRLMKNFSGSEEMRISNPKFGRWYRSTLLGDFWDLGFQAVTGDKVYMIGETRNSLMNFVIEANAPKTEKWIVTKSVQIDGEAICWCIPVELETGKSINVTLSGENTFDVKSVYNQLAAQSVEAAQ